MQVVHLSVGSSSIRTTNASQRFRQEVRIKFCSTQKEFVCWTSSVMCCDLVAKRSRLTVDECASCRSEEGGEPPSYVGQVVDTQCLGAVGRCSAAKVRCDLAVCYHIGEPPDG
jgi:hypothetical protein